MTESAQRENNEDGGILVIKLGAMGDFFQASAPFAAIRAHHADDKTTLLTTPPFADFARAAPWFDHVWASPRVGRFDIGGWLALRKQLRGGRFQRVYDLQTSDRSGWYHKLHWPGPYPEWSGIAKGCSHPHANPRRDFMHSFERQAEQLAMAGIETIPAPDLSWVEADTARLELGERYALLIPGGAAHRPAKRWPVENYAALAKHLVQEGIRPVLIGGADERETMTQILLAEPETRDLAGVTTLADIVALARGAAAAIGNDTGPMHAAAMAGCPSVVLYSNESDPALCAQRGPAVTILRRENLGTLGVGEVIGTLPRS